jgi:hypothetical protein
MEKDSTYTLNRDIVWSQGQNMKQGKAEVMSSRRIALYFFNERHDLWICLPGAKNIAPGVW